MVKAFHVRFKKCMHIKRKPTNHKTHPNETIGRFEYLERLTFVNLITHKQKTGITFGIFYSFDVSVAYSAPNQT